MAYGRPLKSGTRRVPVTVHIPVGTLDIIDQYVIEYRKVTGTSYSRSDFYNDAAVAMLHAVVSEGEALLKDGEDGVTKA